MNFLLPWQPQCHHQGILGPKGATAVLSNLATGFLFFFFFNSDIKTNSRISQHRANAAWRSTTASLVSAAVANSSLLRFSGFWSNSAGSLCLTVDMGPGWWLTSCPERRSGPRTEDFSAHVLPYSSRRFAALRGRGRDGRGRSQGLTSVAGSGQAGAVTTDGWASVENQEDMADLALVKAPPTDWPESSERPWVFRWHLMTLTRF